MGRLKNLAISEEGFVFDPTTGQSFTTNSTGIFIFKLLKEEKSEEEIVKELTEEFEVSEDTAQIDLDDFLYRLRELNLN
jgi:PqqD family protein of HPr-rel-A system